MSSEEAREQDRSRRGSAAAHKKATRLRRERRRRKRLERQLRELRREAANREPKVRPRLYGLTPELEAAVARAIAERRGRRLYRLVRPLHPADFADLIERHSGEDRRLLVTIVGRYFDPDILRELDETVRESVIEYLDDEVLAHSVVALASDDAVDVIGELDREDRQLVLEAFPHSERLQLEQGLAYDDDSAGRLMQREHVSVPLEWTVGQTIDFLRTGGDLPEDFYDLFVVDDDGRPLGRLALSHLLRSKRPVLVADIMDPALHMIPVDTDQEEIALLFRQYGLVSAPVVHPDGRLAGMITVDDVVEVIDEEAEEDLMRLGGVVEDDLHGGLLDTSRSRFSWLAVNLCTAILASIVIGLFESSIEKMVALAVLMPIVASMGGNAGTQSLTVAVRALAMRELTATNATKFILKETTVGSLNGLAFAVIAGAVSWFWFGDGRIALILGAAMIVNLVVAGVMGALIPIGLDRFRLDPAIASTVFLTTVTDVVGFMSFLGLAAFFLL